MEERVFAILLGLFYTLTSMGTPDTASTGNWSSGAIWTSSTSPGSNDTLVIPFGMTVTVDCNCGTYSGMHILVYGALDFPGGRKINMTADGKIDVYPNGVITGTNNGDKINIEGVTVWTGEDGPILGPSSCLSGGCGTNQTLPVELLYSSARPAEQAIEITWATATETGNDYFTVWKSMDDTQWQMLTQVTGSGNSNTLQTYSCNDAEVHPGQSYYYRLSQTDFDGSDTYVGEMIEARVLSPAIDLPYAYPSRDQDEFTVFIPNGWPRIELLVFDLAGNIKMRSPDLVNGNNTVDRTLLNSGIYVIQFRTRMGSVQVQRLALN